MLDLIIIFYLQVRYRWLNYMLFLIAPTVCLQIINTLCNLNSCSFLHKLITDEAPQAIEAIAHRCSVKKVFLEIPQNSHLCQRLLFTKFAPVPETQNSHLPETLLPGLRPATLLKKSFWHRCFPVNFEKFLKGRIHCEIFLSRHFMKY